MNPSSSCHLSRFCWWRSWSCCPPFPCWCTQCLCLSSTSWPLMFAGGKHWFSVFIYNSLRIREGGVSPISTAHSLNLDHKKFRGWLPMDFRVKLNAEVSLRLFVGWRDAWSATAWVTAVTVTLTVVTVVTLTVVTVTAISWQWICSIRVMWCKALFLNKLIVIFPIYVVGVCLLLSRLCASWTSCQSCVTFNLALQQLLYLKASIKI